MMKVQKLDRHMIGSTLVHGKVIHAVSGATDIAIVVSEHPTTLHCYKCSLLSSGPSMEACEHIRLVRKAQNQQASMSLEQPVDKFVFVLKELAEVIENCVILSPYNQSKMQVVIHIMNELRESYAYKPPVNGA